MEALRKLARLEREERPATHVEREVLAAWSSWGAVPEIFDETRAEWAAERGQLHELLGEQGYAAARRTTINAHYTHPVIAGAMWELAGDLGFEGGRVLEPGCGGGVFIGLAPVGAEMTGVELDDTTAAIAQELHPDARIISRSFAQYQPRGLFDLAVGTVPFADVRLYDPVHNRQQHSIHNHFIVKSLALTRPGGLVIVLSSRYTLDAGNPAARREMSELADLLGAVRLPTGAHRRAAGTDALTDLLILRRRPDGTEPLSESWINTDTVQLQGGEARINTHFLEHPDRVLGELTIGHGMYGADTLSVVGELDAETIAAAIALHGRRIAAAAPTPPSTSGRSAATGVDVGEQQLVEAPEGLWDGHLVMLANGTFAEVKDGLEHPIQTPRTIGAELRALLGLRDRARELLAAEAQTLEDTPAITESRARLRADYESYYARYGPINRFDLRRTGRIDPESGQERMCGCNNRWRDGGGNRARRFFRIRIAGKHVEIEHDAADQQQPREDGDFLWLRAGFHRAPPASSLTKTWSLRLMLRTSPFGCGEACMLSMMRKRGERSIRLTNFTNCIKLPSKLAETVIMERSSGPSMGSSGAMVPSRVFIPAV
ncbi:MAG: hypothetical protein ACLP8S_09480 [Solirubrobacteraceae bacterium]